jgi:hypothetical protein
MLGKVKSHLRIKTATAFDEEVRGLIAACITDLKRVGIVIADTAPYSSGHEAENPDGSGQQTEGDPLIELAITLYCKANFGYTQDVDARRFADAYENMARALVLSGDYNGTGTEESEDGVDG